MMEPSFASIIIVDDDDLFRESLEHNLTDAGYRVSGFGDGAAALDHVGRTGAADLVLLDWKMPRMNGIEVLRKLRESRNDVPVIFLTVLSDQIYEEAALTGGAVDFIEKARSFTILLKRIQLILDGVKDRRIDGAAASQGELREGYLDLDLESCRAAWQKRPVELTVTEFRIVHHLASHAGRDVRYRELYDLVRGQGFIAGDGSHGHRANVHNFIQRIRQKFRAVDPEFKHIENYPGFGYRWRDDEGRSS